MNMLTSLKMKAGPLAKKVLLAGNIDPALVRALIKKPAHVHGGPKVRRLPWPRRRHFDKHERDAVLKLMNKEIRHGGVIIYDGPEEKAYTEAFAQYLGGGLAKAVNSGTNAVYVALRALDLEPGSEVIVPPITDAGGCMPVAVMNCIPVPADSDPGSINTSAEQIEKVITSRTSAILLAHVSGNPLNMDPILKLAESRGLPVVEDCAQAHGAAYKGRMVGTMGAIAAFSTMFGKHHSTGAQGGVVFTRDTMLFARARQIVDRGKPYGVVSPSGNEVASLNFNQDEISMAIGRVQLAKLSGAIAARRTFVAAVEKRLSGFESVSVVRPPADSVGSYWFLLLKLNLAKLQCTNHDFATGLYAEGINGVSGGYPFYPTDQPWYRHAIVYGESRLPWSLVQESPRTFELPNAHAANRMMVRVDVHEQLGDQEALDLSTAIQKVARYYKKP
jgi:dTDP-4-amino-4,6-dideoxygalactose transaminase